MILLVFWWIFDMIEGEEEYDVAEGGSVKGNVERGDEMWNVSWDLHVIQIENTFSYSRITTTRSPPPSLDSNQNWVQCDEIFHAWIRKTLTYLLTQCYDDDLIASYRRYVNVLQARTILKMLNDTRIFILNFTYIMSSNEERRLFTPQFFSLIHSLITQSHQIPITPHTSTKAVENGWSEELIFAKCKEWQSFVSFAFNLHVVDCRAPQWRRRKKLL